MGDHRLNTQHVDGLPDAVREVASVTHQHDGAFVVTDNERSALTSPGMASVVRGVCIAQLSLCLVVVRVELRVQHVEAVEVARDLHEAEAVGPSHHRQQICLVHLYRCLEHIVVVGEISNTQIYAGKYFVLIILPEEHAPVRLATQRDQMLLVVLGGE